MQLVNKSSLKIHPTKQTIDRPLGIPKNSPFQDKNSVFCVSGSMGSGKSSWLNSATTCRKADGKIFSGCFAKVFYMTPEDCFTSENDHPFKDHHKSRLFHEFNSDTLNQVVEQALQNKHENNENSLLIIDDFSEELKNLETIRLLKRIIFKHRHYQMSIIISAISLRLIPKSIRSLIDYFVVFRPKSLNEVSGYNEEIFGLNKAEMKSLFDFVYDEPYNFLVFDNKKGKYYRNFDEIGGIGN